MIPADVELKCYEVQYQHVRTGRLYTIWSLGKLQFEGVWHPAVIYQHLTEPPVYVRTETDFRAAFSGPIRYTGSVHASPAGVQS